MARVLTPLAIWGKLNSVIHRSTTAVTVPAGGEWRPADRDGARVTTGPHTP